MKKPSKLKSALVFVGGSIAAVPATALELGDIRVHSTLGQPLRASIAYALGPNEAISDTCVTLQPTRGGAGLPSVDRASMIVADGVIAITGSTIANEPLMALRLNIRCPYTAQITRDYMMFIDPVGTTPEPITAPTPQRVATRPQLEAPPVRAPRPAAVRQRTAEPIATESRYRVQAGESLSEIVARIENRPIGLWPAVNAVFDANPDAFIDNDPNKLKAGSLLTIPSFGAGEPVSVAAAQPAAETPAAGDAGTVYEPPASPTPSDAAAVSEALLAELQPGDVIIDGDNLRATSSDTVVDETIVIPDTRLKGPETTSSNPNGPVQVIQPAAGNTSSTTNWLLWLGGGGIAIILAMLMFGRAFRSRFGSTPIAAALPQPRSTDVDVAGVTTSGGNESGTTDRAAAVPDVALDADLVVGTGLQKGIDIDVAQDFGFAAMTELDLELPEEMSSGGAADSTDIITPITVEETILDSEILPEDDDYDMSVIVDATKMPIPDDVTERDLAAVQVEDGDETLITGDYTVSQEVDYKIIEQDYEDELTATQALNAEIQKAAEDLAARLDDTRDDDATAAMPLATVHELDITAQMKRREDVEISDDDDTGINPTINMEADDDTVNMSDDNTVEMPKNDRSTG